MKVTSTILNDLLQLVCSASNVFDTDSGDLQQGFDCIKCKFQALRDWAPVYLGTLLAVISTW